MSCASSRHITKLKQSIFAPFDIYGTITFPGFIIFKNDKTYASSVSSLEVCGNEKIGENEIKKMKTETFKSFFIF